MVLKKHLFQPYKLEEEKDGTAVLTVRLNEEEVKQLQQDMVVLRQAKGSTALKQVWQIGRNVIHDTKTGAVLRTVLRNVELNVRSGVVIKEPVSDTNVMQSADKNNTFDS